MQYRNLPSVDSVLTQEDVITAFQSFNRDWIVDIVREELEIAFNDIFSLIYITL